MPTHTDDPSNEASGSDAQALPSGPMSDALRLSVRLLEIAATRLRPAEMAQAHAQVGRCYKALAAWPTARSHLEQGVRWAHAAGSVDLVVDLTCDLADAACSAAESQAACDESAAHGLYEAARDHAFEAARLAGQSSDPHWEVKVLLRVSETLDRCGDHDDAIALQTRALTLITHEASGQDLTTASLESSNETSHETARDRVRTPVLLM